MLDLPSAQPGWAADAAPSGAPFGGAGARRIGPGAGYGRRRGAARRTVGTLVASFVMMWALLALGIIAVFGLGGGRPFGIVLIIAAFALLRRLIVGIFRRRRGGPRGPRRRRW
jgi:hypothetical protein